jgi:iron(III) transport system substrate-binding protein
MRVRRLYPSCVFAASLIVLSAATPAFSQSGPSGASVAKIAGYQGADRTQRLLAGAKREQQFLLYTNIAAADAEKVASDFERRYGVKIEVWRAPREKILQRIIAEARANRPQFDAVHISTPEAEALYREGLLQPVASPHLKHLVREAVPAHKAWAASFLSVWVQAYNTQAVKKEELPKTYSELLDGRWKGKLGIEATNHEWFYTIVKDMGEERGLKFFKQLVTHNGLSARSGATLLSNLVVSGEVPLALNVYNFMAEQRKQQGAAIDWFAIEPAIARGNAVGVSKKAARPHAAVLFFDYMISDAQQLLTAMDHVPTNTLAPSPLKNTKFKLVDPAVVLDESDKSMQLYEEVVLRAAK